LSLLAHPLPFYNRASIISGLAEEIEAALSQLHGLNTRVGLAVCRFYIVAEARAVNCFPQVIAKLKGIDSEAASTGPSYSAF